MGGSPRPGPAAAAGSVLTCDFQDTLGILNGCPFVQHGVCYALGALTVAGRRKTGLQTRRAPRRLASALCRLDSVCAAPAGATAATLRRGGGAAPWRAQRGRSGGQGTGAEPSGPPRPGQPHCPLRGSRSRGHRAAASWTVWAAVVMAGSCVPVAVPGAGRCPSRDPRAPNSKRLLRASSELRGLSCVRLTERLPSGDPQRQKLLEEAMLCWGAVEAVSLLGPLRRWTRSFCLATQSQERRLMESVPDVPRSLTRGSGAGAQCGRRRPPTPARAAQDAQSDRPRALGPARRRVRDETEKGTP